MMMYGNSKQEPWLVKFLLSDDDICAGQYLQVLKTLQGPLKNGSILKEVSDGTNTLGALFTTEAIEEWKKKCEEDDMEADDFDGRVIIKEYSRQFVSNDNQAKCLFLLQVEAFESWGDIPCFSFKASTTSKYRHCMHVDVIQQKLQEMWSIQRKDSEGDTTTNGSEYLSQLVELAKIPHVQVEAVAEELDKDGLISEKAEIAVNDALDGPGYAPQESHIPVLPPEFDINYFVINNEDQAKLDAMPEWKFGYQPPACKTFSSSQVPSMEHHLHRPSDKGDSCLTDCVQDLEVNEESKIRGKNMESCSSEIVSKGNRSFKRSDVLTNEEQNVTLNDKMMEVEKLHKQSLKNKLPADCVGSLALFQEGENSEGNGHNELTIMEKSVHKIHEDSSKEASAPIGTSKVPKSTVSPDSCFDNPMNDEQSVRNILKKDLVEASFVQSTQIDSYTSRPNFPVSPVDAPLSSLKSVPRKNLQSKQNIIDYNLGSPSVIHDSNKKPKTTLAPISKDENVNITRRNIEADIEEEAANSEVLSDSVLEIKRLIDDNPAMVQKYMLDEMKNAGLSISINPPGSSVQKDGELEQDKATSRKSSELCTHMSPEMQRLVILSSPKDSKRKKKSPESARLEKLSQPHNEGANMKDKEDSSSTLPTCSSVDSSTEMRILGEMGQRLCSNSDDFSKHSKDEYEKKVINDELCVENRKGTNVALHDDKDNNLNSNNQQDECYDELNEVNKFSNDKVKQKTRQKRQSYFPSLVKILSGKRAKAVVDYEEKHAELDCLMSPQTQTVTTVKNSKNSVDDPDFVVMENMEDDDKDNNLNSNNQQDECYDELNEVNKFSNDKVKQKTRQKRQSYFPSPVKILSGKRAKAVVDYEEKHAELDCLMSPQTQTGTTVKNSKNSVDDPDFVVMENMEDEYDEPSVSKKKLACESTSNVSSKRSKTKLRTDKKKSTLDLTRNMAVFVSPSKPKFSSDVLYKSPSKKRLSGVRKRRLLSSNDTCLLEPIPTDPKVKKRVSILGKGESSECEEKRVHGLIEKSDTGITMCKYKTNVRLTDIAPIIEEIENNSPKRVSSVMQKTVSHEIKVQHLTETHSPRCIENSKELQNCDEKSSPTVLSAFPTAGQKHVENEKDGESTAECTDGSIENATIFSCSVDTMVTTTGYNEVKETFISNIRSNDEIGKVTNSNQKEKRDAKLSSENIHEQTEADTLGETSVCNYTCNDNNSIVPCGKNFASTSNTAVEKLSFEKLSLPTPQNSLPCYQPNQRRNSLRSSQEKSNLSRSSLDYSNRRLSEDLFKSSDSGKKEKQVSNKDHKSVNKMADLESNVSSAEETSDDETNIVAIEKVLGGDGHTEQSTNEYEQNKHAHDPEDKDEDNSINCAGVEVIRVHRGGSEICSPQMCEPDIVQQMKDLVGNEVVTFNFSSDVDVAISRFFPNIKIKV